MTPLRAIFFDIGDTLVYDVPSVEERLWTASRECGIEYPRARLTGALRVAETYALKEYVRGRPPETPEIAIEMLRSLLAYAGADAPSRDALAALAAAYAQIPFRRVLQERALPLLDELRRRGFVLGIVSDWEDTLEELLRDLGVMDRVDAMAVSAIVGVTKPDPRIFRAALDQAGVRAEESLHVGDYRELDVAGAHAAGMQAVLFDWRKRENKNGIPRVESFDELCDILLGLPPPNAGAENPKEH